MKHTAYLNYSANIEGIKFDSLEPEIHDPLIESLILKMTDAQKISLEFIVNTDSIEQTRELTRKIVDKFVDGFYFFYSAKVSSLSLASQTMEVTDEDGNTTTTAYIHGMTRFQGYVTGHSLINKLDPRFVALVNSDDQKYFLYKQFGFAMQVDDPVARYMLLYSLLLQTKEDRQKEVDQFICIKEKDVKTSKPPQRPKPVKSPPQDEIIYTTLRNEIGHVRKGSTFKETCQQIESKVKGLEHLTKLAIEEFQPPE
jgi:hypothetical protein